MVRVLGGGAIIRWWNRHLRSLVKFTHRVQFLIEWGTSPTAHWFDHNLDLYYRWHETRNPQGWERGVFSLLAMRQGARVLDVCCGDGFYANYFYSVRAGAVVAFDIDQEAIRSARRNFSAPNVKYVVADAIAEMPQGQFDNIVWESAIEYFTGDEIHQVMRSIKSRLAEGGILSGHAVIQQERNSGQKLAFKNRADFLSFLQPHFSRIRIFETIYPARHNIYFYAGEGDLPFDEKWNLQVKSEQAENNGLFNL